MDSGALARIGILLIACILVATCASSLGFGMTQGNQPIYNDNSVTIDNSVTVSNFLSNNVFGTDYAIIAGVIAVVALVLMSPKRRNDDDE